MLACHGCQNGVLVPSIIIYFRQKINYVFCKAADNEYFDSDSLFSRHTSVLHIGNPLVDILVVVIYFVYICESDRKLHREVAIFYIYSQQEI